MKNFYLTILILFSLKMFPQSNINPTTVEEYKYMTVGYKTQVDGGLDTKSGYEIVDIITIQRDTYTFDFKILFRIDTQEPAGTIVIAYSKIWNNKYYIGIPIISNNNTDLLSNYENSISVWDEPMTTAYAQACSLMYSIYMHGSIECAKNK